MVMTCQEYSHYLRGYAQAAVRELPSMQGTFGPKPVDVTYDLRTGNFLVGVGGYGFAITECQAADNVGEQRIDEEVKRLFDMEGTIARISEIKPHPVVDAIAAMRTGAPYIGGDRH